MSAPACPPHWPTLDELRKIRAAFIFPEKDQEILHCLDATEWAVVVRPQLEALIESANAWLTLVTVPSILTRLEAILTAAEQEK